jgi:hypothetical protein
MAISVIAAAPSFADGLRILLGHTGVEQVQSYPSGVHSSASMVNPPHSAAPSRLLAQVDWFGPSVGKYIYSSAMVNRPTQWSDGPMVELQYTYQGSSHGSGLLDVREFQLSPEYAGVLQVVADGSADAVTVDGLPGVYVDGHWVHSGTRPTWESGVKSELIFERDGLIFWIVADQQDGMGEDQLVAAAQQLQPVPLSTLISSRLSLRGLSEDLAYTLRGPNADEVYYLIPSGSSLDSGAGEFVSYAYPEPTLQ